MSITLFGISFRGIGVSRECSDSCPEKKNKYGMAQHAKEMKAIREVAHWSPNLWYIWIVKRAHAPQMDLTNVLAANAEAA